MADLIEVHAIYAQMSNMTPRPLLLKFQVIAGVNIMPADFPECSLLQHSLPYTKDFKRATGL